MKAARIKGIAIASVDRFGIALNGKDIRDIIKDALQPTEEEIENYEKIPVNVIIQIEPIKTGLEIEHIGESDISELEALVIKDIKKAS